MFYYLEGTFTDIFAACGLESMIAKRDLANNIEIQKDLYGRIPFFHMTGIKEILEQHFLPNTNLHLMPKLPDDLTGYKGCYIYCNQRDNKKLYYIKSNGAAEDVPVNVFSQFDRELNRIPREQENLFKLTHDEIGTLITSNGGYTHLPVNADPIRNHYMQGDMEATNLKFMLGHVPFYDSNDPEDEVTIAMSSAKDARGGYIDSQKKPTGITIFYRKGHPEQWMIAIAKNTHLPKEQRKVHILSSVDPKTFMIADDSLEKVEEVDLRSLPEKVGQLKAAADSPAIGEIIQRVLNTDGTISEHPALFELFTGSIKRGKQFDDDPKWMQLLQERFAEIIKNPFVIDLFSSLDERSIRMSREEIEACLDEKSELVKAVKYIQANESLKEHKEVKKELLLLAHNLYQLGHIDKFSEFANFPEKKNGFFDFFNKLAEDTKSHRFLKNILESEKLDHLRTIYNAIQKCNDVADVIKRLKESDEQERLINQLIIFTQNIPQPKNEEVLALVIELVLRAPADNQALLIDQLEGLTQYLTEQTVSKKAKNEDVLSLTIEFLLRHPIREAIPENPLIFLKNDIAEIERFPLNRQTLFCELKKLIGFLNNAEGIKKLKPELLTQFLAEHLNTQGLNNELWKAVQETVAKLDALKVKNSAAYSLALRSIEFRRIVAGLKVEEVEKNQKCIELALNLDKMGRLATYSAFAGDLEWVNAFNQFVKYEELKNFLVEKISIQGAEACKALLKNERLSALVSADIKVTKAQANKIINPQEPLSEQLNGILKNKDYNPPKRKILYQLALDLDMIDASEAFKELAQEDNKFLEWLHESCLAPENRKLLTPMLSGYASGLGVLKLMVYSDVPFALFRGHFNHVSQNLVDALNWLNRNKPTPEITSLAIRFLFKKPNLEIGKLESVIKFLQDTPKCGVDRKSITEFLAANHEDPALLSRVNAVYKKLAALGNIDNKFYTLALEEKRFRAVVEGLPPISADQDCGFIRMDETPKDEILRTYKGPNYILTKEGLFYYNPSSHNKLLTINLEGSELKELKEKFPQTIDKLTAEQFAPLTTLIKKYNIILIELAEKLAQLGHLDKYENFASNTQLASTFVRLANIKYITRLELIKRLDAMDYGLKLMPESDGPLSAEAIKDDTVYIKLEKDLFHYTVKTPEGQIEEGTIPAKDIKKFNPEKPLDEQLPTVKSNILAITSERGHTCSKEPSEVLKLLANKRLIALLEADIDPSDAQLRRLLDPNSEKSKAMDILVSLKLDVAKREAHQWVIIDSSAAKNFRKILFQINKKDISDESKAKMIGTLCSLQLGDEPQMMSLRHGKDVFSLYLSDEPKGRKFRRSIDKIEETCTKIKARWNTETAPTDAKAKAKAFEAEEQRYRKGLFEVVFDNLHTPMSKKDFEGRIQQVSQNMLAVVDERRRSWFVAIMETLADGINFIFGTLPSRIGTDKHRAFFFGHTTSGYQVRDLHESLRKPDDVEASAVPEDSKEPEVPRIDPVNKV
ncbi:hypothetical protein OQJ26_17920 [Legionella sp. PATHC038]|uniref:hypothetical protein n=1 Tax=Legionella sheltonii TaxID=2992041 RepID=UPI0022447E1A|nr:hypothetical protein [Legionella sp. PATHC038]MCW8400661.1 hypothetical protein [Legionella sp. PATHC038]